MENSPNNQPNIVGGTPQGQPMQPIQPAPQQPAMPQQAQPIQQTVPVQQVRPVLPQGQPMQQPTAQQVQPMSQPMAPQGQPMMQQPMQQAPQMQQQNMQPAMQRQNVGQPNFQGQPMPGQPGQPLRPGQRPVKQAGGPSPKKLIFGCLGFIAFAVILFVLFVIVFVSQTSATGQNGLASSLGVNPAEFTNSLILLTNLVFGIIVMITFFISVFGLFRAGMAPKVDKPARSRGFRQAAIAGAIFLVMVMLWVFVYIYLNGKKAIIPTKQNTVSGIVTTPEVTTRLTAPVDVKFDGTKIPYNTNKVEVTFYQWDFGDGSSSTAPTVTHTYREVGQFEAKLSVTARDKTTNEQGTDTFTKLITVSEVKVSADFSMSPETGPAPLTVDFDASSSSSPAGEISTYEWDFKGQNNFRDANGQTAEYTFERAGDYDVKLRVTDTTGQSAIVSKTITIGGPDLPVPVIEIPTTDGKYYVNKQLTFLGEKSTSPSGEIVKYEWDFGDGSPKANTRTATHTYKAAGLYEVILKATDETGKAGSSSQKLNLVTQEQAPQAIISTDPVLGAQEKSLSGQAPFEVNFDASGSTDPDKNIVEFKWDFDGDNTIDSAGTTANYVYKTPGSYNATLTAIDAAGNQSTAILVIKVAAQGLTARLAADKVEGNVPLTVTFDASSSTYPDGQITSYEWNFGDGSPKVIGASQISYKYSSIGTFTASVIAKASDGKTSTATIVVNIRPVSLQACFTPSVEQGEAPLSVEFDPRCSQGSVAKYLWDFGDGETSRTRKPVHIFDKAGSYQVTLEVTDNQNVVNSFSKNILVTGIVQ